MFQRGDFEIVDAVPAGAIRYRAWDFAASEQKKGKQPDWTVGLSMAKVGGTFYVEGCAPRSVVARRRREEPEEYRQSRRLGSPCQDA